MTDKYLHNWGMGEKYEYLLILTACSALTDICLENKTHTHTTENNFIQSTQTWMSQDLTYCIVHAASGSVTTTNTPLQT